MRFSIDCFLSKNEKQINRESYLTLFWLATINKIGQYQVN